MGGVAVGPRRAGATRAATGSVDQRDHYASAHSSSFKHLKSFYHGFDEPLAPFPACPATSTSSPCRKVSSCRWWSSSSAASGPGPGFTTSTPPPLRHPSHQPAQGLRRSGPARQDGLVLWFQAAPCLQQRQ